MWPFTKHLTLRDYLSDLQTLVTVAEKDIENIYQNSDQTPLMNILIALESVDEKGLKDLKKEGVSIEFIKAFDEIKQEVLEARVDLENGDFARAHQILSRLKNVIASTTVLSQSNLPVTRLISDILSISQREAEKRGYLFRGISVDEYDRFKQGLSLYAKNPGANLPLFNHILGQSIDQFISFTTDALTAARFSQGVLVVRKEKLRGNLLDASQIERKIAGDTRAKRLVIKNTEFILEPASGQPAEIPAEAFVFVGIG